MTEEVDNKEEAMRIHRLYQRAIADQIMPLLPDRIATDDNIPAVGLLCVRVFYAVKIDDKDVSVGQVGITPEGAGDVATRLVLSIMDMLADKENNRQFELVQRTDKKS